VMRIGRHHLNEAAGKTEARSVDRVIAVVDVATNTIFDCFLP
jgi:hypothetical protein